VNVRQLESLFQRFATHGCDNPNIKLTLEDIKKVYVCHFKLNAAIVNLPRKPQNDLIA
jgi:hypothetical protein